MTAAASWDTPIAFLVDGLEPIVTIPIQRAAAAYSDLHKRLPPRGQHLLSSTTYAASSGTAWLTKKVVQAASSQNSTLAEQLTSGSIQVILILTIAGCTSLALYHLFKVAKP